MNLQAKNLLLEQLQNYNPTSGQPVSPILMEILRYERLNAIVMLISLPLILCIAGYICYKAWKNPQRDAHGDRYGTNEWTIWCSSFICLISTGIICTAIDILIKLSVAPHYFLIKLLTK